MKKTPSVNGANDQQYSKSESRGNYTKSSLSYKELCDSIQSTAKENYNGK
jgi:hypothetical protein